MEVMGNDDTTGGKLLKEKLAGLTTDGAAVMISARGGVYEKLKEAVNPNCSLHTALLIVLYLHPKHSKKNYSFR
jgi:hypothetical protein